MQISVPGEIFDTHVITRLPTCRAAFRAPRITVAGQSRTHTGLPLVTLFLRVSFVNAYIGKNMFPLFVLSYHAPARKAIFFRMGTQGDHAQGSRGDDMPPVK